MAEIIAVSVDDVEDLRAWLEANYAQRASVWLVRWRKGSGRPYLTYGDVVDTLLCYGWVDSIPRKVDEQRTKLLISPRSPRSNWSAINKARVARLMKEGRMHPAGSACVAQARANGTWDALNSVDALEIPADLAAALSGEPRAALCFERFPRSSKRGILEWIANAKRPETRARRIAETVSKAARNVKANHPKGRDHGPRWNDAYAAKADRKSSREAPGCREE